MFLLHLLGASAITSTSNTSISLTISKSLAWVKTPCCTWGHARYKKSNLELSWISSDQQQATPTRWPEGKQKDETKCLSRNRKQKQKSKKKNLSFTFLPRLITTRNKLRFFHISLKTQTKSAKVICHSLRLAIFRL